MLGGTVIALVLHSWIAMLLFLIVGYSYEAFGTRCSPLLSSVGIKSAALFTMLVLNVGFPIGLSVHQELLLLCGVVRVWVVGVIILGAVNALMGLVGRYLHQPLILGLYHARVTPST